MKKYLLLIFILILASGCASTAIRKHCMCDIIAADKFVKLAEEGDVEGIGRLAKAMKKSAIANLRALGGALPDEYIDESNVEEKYDESAKEAEEQGASTYAIIAMILTILGINKYKDSIIKGIQFIGHAATHAVGYKTGEDGKYGKVA